MNKEIFLKELEKNLKYLNQESKKEELEKYQNLEDYNLDPVKVANDIYLSKGLTFKINPKTKFLDSLNIIANTLRKGKEETLNILLFFLWLLFLIIMIKVPFILVSDLISSLFINLNDSETLFTIYNLIFDLLYVITALIIAIKQINNKAYTLENKEGDTDGERPQNS